MNARKYTVTHRFLSEFWNEPAYLFLHFDSVHKLSFRQLHKILQQLQSNLLAFVRVKLRS
jgi:hypothetical protein